MNSACFDNQLMSEPQIAVRLENVGHNEFLNTHKLVSQKKKLAPVERYSRGAAETETQGGFLS